MSNWEDIDLTVGGGDSGFFGFLSAMYRRFFDEMCFNIRQVKHDLWFILLIIQLVIFVNINGKNQK